jgi:hypothetical protein
MSKRFTETEKWKDTFFRKLPPYAKLLYSFILDNCDCAGFWEIDLDLAAFHTGIDEGELKAAFDEIRSRFIFDGEKKYVWCRNFLKHQGNANLDVQSKPHIGILRCIASHQSLTEQVLTLLHREDLIDRLHDYI